MRKFLFTVMIGLVYIARAKAQVDTIGCDYPDRDTTELESIPWFGNNDYLENFLDSIGYPAANNNSRIIGPNQVRYHVPIKFWVYRSNGGIGGPTQAQLANYIDNLNRFYNTDNNTLIGFYMKCDIGFIDDDDHLDINSDLEAWGLIQNHKEKGCINIHITNTLNDNAVGVSYRARFFGVDAIFLARVTYTNAALASTIAHEVGHYFELDHTHQYSNRGKCRKEAIDRNRTWPFFSFCPFGGGGPSNQRVCEATGDLLRDTPADHDLSNNNSCNYTITGQTDPWGDHYETPPTGSPSPDPTNIMSYNGLRGCRDFFSRLQIAVMLHSIVRGKSKSNRAGWESLKAEYDEYEPDNNSLMAREILFGEIQERNFHEQYTTEDAWGNPVWTMCDPDWAWFIAPCNEVLHVFTTAMAGRLTADTRLTLFDNNLTQLAQNDNISPTNTFSDISWNFQAGHLYFIRVENMITDQNRYYRLHIGYASSISGNPIVCSAENFTVPSITGATYTWLPATSTLATLAPNNNQMGVTRNYNAHGSINLSAQINGACGSSTVSRIIEIGAGAPAPDFGGMLSGGELCQGNIFNVYTNGPYNSYTWSVIGGYVAYGQGTYEAHVYVDYLIPPQTTGYYEVNLQVYDDCGDQLPLVVKYATVKDCIGGGIESRGQSNPAPTKPVVPPVVTKTGIPWKIYPNPANEYLIIELPADFIGSHLKLIGLQGQVNKMMIVSGSLIKLDIRSLKAGVYIIESTSKSGHTERSKIVIVH